MDGGALAEVILSGEVIVPGDIEIDGAGTGAVDDTHRSVVDHLLGSGVIVEGKQSVRLGHRSGLRRDAVDAIDRIEVAVLYRRGGRWIEDFSDELEGDLS